MRRVFGMISIIILLSLACQTLLPISSPTPLPSETITATFTPTRLPSQTPTPSPSQTPNPPASLSTIFPPPPAADYLVRYHPDDRLYVGDLVSLEVIPSQEESLKDSYLSIQIDSPNGYRIGPVAFGAWGIAGRKQATMIWSWDTREVESGEHRLYFSIQPDGISWTETVSLYPAEQLPSYYAQAKWTDVETHCCEIHYLTGTAAERDLQSLTIQIEEKAQQASEQLGIGFEEQVVITLLPRLLGHGGFATDEIQVSYLDRNYAANDWDQVVYHEMIHILDKRWGGDLRPILLVEGLAVYLSGGHYKTEPLMQRAAALLDDELGWYLPLQSLADDFYSSQHEIGYLQAGALVEYMIQTFGWQVFLDFYHDIHPAQSGKESDAIDQALLRSFNISFDQLERSFMDTLLDLPEEPAWQADVRITVALFDTLRRYQVLLDPSAYFRTAWLLDSDQMRQHQISADYLRHPDSLANLTLETMLQAAGNDLDNPPYPVADQLISAINLVLTALENQEPMPFSVHPSAENYHSIVQVLVTSGYIPQKIDLQGNHAEIYATLGSNDLYSLQMQKMDGGWIILED